MGQAMQKLSSVWRSTPSSATHLKHKPADSRFGDPRLRGHLPGDVHPPPPYPPGDDSREWDRTDPMYQEMIKNLAGTVVTRGGTTAQGAHFRRPLPTNRQRTGSGTDENTIVTPGTLNVGHIRQLFVSYQGSSEGDGKPMDVKELAEKFNVDAILLEKVLHFYAMPEKKDALEKEDSSSRSTKN